MKQRIIGRLIVVCALLIQLAQSSIVSHAQDKYVDEQTGQSMYLRYRVGGYAGALFNMYNVGFGALPGYVSCCSTFDNTVAPNFAVGALAEFNVAESLVLDARIGYGGLSSRFERTQLIGNEPVLTDGIVGTADRRDINVQHSLDATLSMLSIEPTLRYSLDKKLSLLGGLRAGYLLSPTFSQQETLISPEGYVFIDGSAIRNQQSGPIPTAATMTMHAALGIHYDLWQGATYTFGLDARYYYPINRVADVDWTVHALQAGVSVAWGVFTPGAAIERFDTVYVRDTTVLIAKGISVETIRLDKQNVTDNTHRVADTVYTTTTIAESYVKRIPRPFDPGLTVRLEGRDGDGQPVETSVLRIEEMDVIESFPILPEIFFAENSSSLSQTTQQILDENSVLSFSTSLLSRNQLSVYNNLLNIIGQRMSLDPETKITVAGYGSNQGVEQGSKEIARARAEAVRSYLIQMWGIEQQRITLRAGLLPPQPANSATPDGRAENQRVEITPNNLTLVEPVEFRDRDLTYTPKMLAIKPTIKEIDEVASWRSTLRQGVVQLTSAQGNTDFNEVLWNPATMQARPRRNLPFIASYAVTNAAGTEIEVHDTLPVDYVTLQMIRSRREEGKLVERYSLIVFDFNSAQLSPANQRTMQKVKERIQPDSKVRIVGYADRTGNPEYNRSLARKRCLEAQRVLGVADDRVQIDPIGSDALIYNNDTPEGRSYSRTVQIEIETPIK